MTPRTVAALVNDAETRGLHLWVSGEKIRYRGPQGALSLELAMELRSRKPELLEFLNTRARQPAQKPEFVRRLPGDVPITHHFRMLWDPIEKGTYGVDVTNGTHFLRLHNGTFDLEAWTEGINILTHRHGILRARIARTDSRAAFRFDATNIPATEYVDCCLHNDADAYLAAKSKAREYVWAPFFPERGLFRSFVIKISSTQHVVGFVIHHFIADMLSVRIAAAELISLYFAHTERRQISLPLPPFDFGDYVAGIIEWLDTAQTQAYRKFWRDQLAGAGPTIIPVDRIAGANEFGPVERESCHVGRELVTRLLELARAESTTLFLVLLAAKVMALSQASRITDVSIAIMVSGRLDPEFENVVGGFASHIRMRLDIAREDTFTVVLAKTKNALAAVYEHQRYPSALVRADLRGAESPGECPLFNFIEPIGQPARAPGGNKCFQPFEIGLPELPMSSLAQFSSHYFRMVHSGGQLRGELTYLTLSYERTTVQRFLQTFVGILERAALRN